jgi:hypothetical protein
VAISAVRGRARWVAPVPVPGGSTSANPRAGVEQYSSPTHSPSRTSSGGTSASSARSGVASRSGASSLRSARSTTTPRIWRRANGTITTLPTPSADISPGSA